jgi:hypothetical protein
VLSGPPVSTPRRAALLDCTSARTRPLPLGFDVARPHMSAAPFRVAHAAILPCSQPTPAVPVRRAPPTAIRAARSRCVRAVPINVAEPWTLLRFSPPHGAEPRTPTPPLPPLQKATATAHSSLPPSLSSAHGHTSDTHSPPFLASRPRRRTSHRGPHRLSTAVVVVSLPHG